MEILLIISVALAAVCAWVAEQKGRDQLGWGIAGFFFGIFALLVLACAPPLKKAE